MEKQITFDQFNDLYGDLVRDRDKLQFLEETLFLIAGNQIDFMDNADEGKNSNILHGLTNIIEEVAANLDGVINKMNDL